MAITFTNGVAGPRFTFDSTLEFVLWALVLPLVFGACMGALFTVYHPDLADRLIIHAVHAVVAAGRLLKSLLVVPAPALG